MSNWRRNTKASTAEERTGNHIRENNTRSLSLSHASTHKFVSPTPPFYKTAFHSVTTTNPSQVHFFKFNVIHCKLIQWRTAHLCCGEGTVINIHTYIPPSPDSLNPCHYDTGYNPATHGKFVFLLVAVVWVQDPLQ